MFFHEARPTGVILSIGSRVYLHELMAPTWVLEVQVCPIVSDLRERILCWYMHQKPLRDVLHVTTSNGGSRRPKHLVKVYGNYHRICRIILFDLLSTRNHLPIVRALLRHGNISYFLSQSILQDLSHTFTVVIEGSLVACQLHCKFPKRATWSAVNVKKR